MASLNIKDPTVHEMAHALATLRGTSATAAVRDALSEALERERGDRTGVAERLRALAEEAALVREPFLRDEDLYDDEGLPR